MLTIYLLIHKSNMSIQEIVKSCSILWWKLTRWKDMRNDPLKENTHKKADMHIPRLSFGHQRIGL
jgi:hypothetical protein